MSWDPTIVPLHWKLKFNYNKLNFLKIRNFKNVIRDFTIY